MRYQGKIKAWKDDKGFGFIVPNGGGPDVFLHISAFGLLAKRPDVGDLVSYELSVDEKKRPRAGDVRFVGGRIAARRYASPSVGSLVVGIVILGIVGHIAYVRLSHPNSTVSASAYKVFFARSALHNDGQFQCTPHKSYCSQMTSCSEAFFHQERCGVADMDGDGDGIPCEKQWCN